MVGGTHPGQTVSLSIKPSLAAKAARRADKTSPFRQ
jgi:hypothetical protein